jgi:C4-dicarboxylate transporter DctQ subunit
LVTFVQVVLRYGFHTQIEGALEITTVLFAWLILFGMSYAVKINTHLGVDAFINFLPPKLFKAVAIFGSLAGLLYAVLLIYSDWLQFFGVNTKGGAIAYWSLMYKIGIGMEDIRYPIWAQEVFGLQERMHRWVAYFILPTGLALFAYRCLQATIDIWRGDRRLIIASHEAEQLVEDNKDSV